MSSLLPEIQILSELPLDVARLIVELAGSADTSFHTVLSLSLVSREIQSWSDRSLFRSIVVEDGSIPKPMVQFMDAFASDDPSPRLLIARNYVRNISTKQEDDADGLLLSFVNHCPRLHSLALWAMPLPNDFRMLWSPYIRKLTFANTPHVDGFSFSNPFFHTITHLELIGYLASQWPLLWADGLSSMTTLTHLVLDATEITDSLLPYLSDASANMPATLRVLLLFVDPRQSEPESDAYDQRILLATRSSMESKLPFIDLGWEAWTGEMKEEDTLWVQAERMLELRYARAERLQG